MLLGYAAHDLKRLANDLEEFNLRFWCLGQRKGNCKDQVLLWLPVLDSCLVSRYVEKGFYVGAGLDVLKASNNEATGEITAQEPTPVFVDAQSRKFYVLVFLFAPSIG